MDTIKTADITVWRMMINYFAPETLRARNSSQQTAFDIVISYLYITVLYLRRIHDRDRFFFFCGFQRFLSPEHIWGFS